MLIQERVVRVRSDSWGKGKRDVVTSANRWVVRATGCPLAGANTARPAPRRLVSARPWSARCSMVTRMVCGVRWLCERTCGRLCGPVCGLDGGGGVRAGVRAGVRGWAGRWRGGAEHSPGGLDGPTRGNVGESGRVEAPVPAYVSGSVSAHAILGANTPTQRGGSKSPRPETVPSSPSSRHRCERLSSPVVYRMVSATPAKSMLS